MHAQIRKMRGTLYSLLRVGRTVGEGNIDQCQSLLMDQTLGPFDALCCPRGDRGTDESVSTQEDSTLRAWYLSDII